ncbi:hypothetical protein OSTOST_24210 [Ostertagia ostertagi]
MYALNVPGRIDPVTNRAMLPTNLPKGRLQQRGFKAS